MAEALSTSADLETFRPRYNGQFLLQGEPGYDEHRQHFNRRFDKHPALIVRPVNTVDVVATIRYARAAGLEVSSGGKHMAGFARVDDGVVIDLSLKRAVEVDPAEQTARAQGGPTGSDPRAETGRHGPASVIGRLRGTGIGGVNMDGRFGMVSSTLDWAVDTILEVEMVTAEGDVLRVTPEENPDLCWKVRGAAGSFGVVTCRGPSFWLIVTTALSTIRTRQHGERSRAMYPNAEQPVHAGNLPAPDTSGIRVL